MIAADFLLTQRRDKGQVIVDDSQETREEAMASKVSCKGSWVYGTIEIRDHKQLVQPSSTSSSFSPFLRYRHLNLDICYPMDPRPDGRGVATG